MSTPTAEELLPLLVADLADAASLDLLRDAASRHAVVIVPLLGAPVDRRRHVLEAYAPGCEPERFGAEPAGAPTDEGFPLRLGPHASAGEELDDDDAPTLMRAPSAARGRTTGTAPSLTKRHTRDLDPIDASSRADAPHRGRLLAGGKYRLDQLVGEGGMGAVYRAHHRDLDKHVAVKVLHASIQTDVEFSRRFHGEALAMSRIDHPNVARVLDFGQEPDGLLYLAMEFLDGVDLERVLEQDGRLPLERVVRIGTQVCAALGHVHRHGIIHRDVKPTNIVLVAGLDEEDETPTEIVKVLDFGIALTRGSSGRVAGTPEYMSPEQCRGAELDPRSDVYACGVVLYELATGTLPFRGEAHEVLRRHLTDPPPPPSLLVPDIDPLLEAVIVKALAKDPAERHASMRHLRNDLRELLAPVFVEDGAPPASGPIAADGASIRPAGRHASSAERWFGEDGRGEVQITALASMLERETSFHDGDLLADELARDPTDILATITATIDVAAFAERTKPLQQAVRKLMKQADEATLAPIVAAMRRVLREERAVAAGESRVKWAGRVLRVLRDPPKLAPLVDKALGAPDDPSPALRHVLVETQEAGAEALVVGRYQRHAGANARVRYVALTKEIGAAAVPTLRSALQGALARGERSGGFVEDVLRAFPPVPDEASGVVVAEFLRETTAPTTAAALVALSTLWGDRARPLLLGALGVADDTVRVAAIASLRTLRAIDEQAVRQLAPIVLGTTPASDELRVSAVAALAAASPAAKADAGASLFRAFARATAARSGASASFVVALARALIAVRAPDAPSVIRERAALSPDGLRAQLLALLS